jgi:hypothetical protein
MMCQDEPEQLFYDLESHVPRDSICCAGSTRFFDLDAIRKSLEPYYSSTRRPSIDPELMLRMLRIQPKNAGRVGREGALKRRGVLVVLGVETSDRPDGRFDMGRKERQLDVCVGHGLSSTT